MRRSRSLPLLAAALLAACDDGNRLMAGPSNTAPVAEFTAQCETLSCTFINASSDSDGSIESYDWDFGDGGEHGADRNAARTYAAPGGRYTITLVVTDDDGASTTATRNVEVSQLDVAPTADFTFRCNGLDCAFTSASHDGNAGGTLASYAWDFGDGASSTDVNPAHAYSAGGIYTVALSVTNTFGRMGSITRELTVGVTFVGVTPEGSADPSRYILLENGTFALQYPSRTGAPFQWTGRYSVNDSIAFTFDADYRWKATGTILGDSLVVKYNFAMSLSGFEDGVYIRETPPPPELAFTRGGDIYAMNADGSGLRQVTSGLGDDYEAAWSPDGRRIAFTRYRADMGHPRWGEAAIYVVKADGTGLVRLSARGDSTYDAHPTWSPDGTRIAFYSRREHDADPFHANDSDIYVMNADGSSPARLTYHRTLVFHPAWSPDGSRIAYRAWNTDADDWSLYVMQADGGQPTPILTGDGAYAPAWSPDGGRILTRTVKCLQWTDPDPAPEIGPDCVQWEGPHLIAVGVNGSSPVRLSDYVINGDDQAATPASWSPDGAMIAFTQLQCTWPAAAWSCPLPTYVEILRLSDGKVTRLTQGASPSWRR